MKRAVRYETQQGRICAERIEKVLIMALTGLFGTGKYEDLWKGTIDEKARFGGLNG